MTIHHQTIIVSLLAMAAAPVAAWSPGEPLTLETSLRLALDRNPALRAAGERVREGDGRVEEASSGRLPSLRLTAQIEQIDSGQLDSFEGFTFGSSRNWGSNLNLTQNLYAGGAVDGTIEGARRSRGASLFEYEAAGRNVLLNVRERFFDLLLAREQVAVQEESVRLLEEELSTARSRVDAGVGSEFDRLRAEVALANGRPPLIRARNNLRLAGVELGRAIGLDPENSTTGVHGRLEYRDQDYRLPVLISAARDNRPELKGFRERVEAAEAAREVARAGARPNLAVVAGYGIRSSTFSDSLSDTLRGWSVGLQGNWAIFDGKATSGRIVQAEARREQARLALRDAELAVDAEVRRAHSNWEEAKELYLVSRKVVEQAEESLRLARARFDAGAATQLDVLQSQVALTQARTNEVLALHEVNVSSARLDRAAATPEPLLASVRER